MRPRLCSSLEGKILFVAGALLLGTWMPQLRVALGVPESSVARLALDGIAGFAYYRFWIFAVTHGPMRGWLQQWEDHPSRRDRGRD